MAKTIKLENIKDASFSPVTGKYTSEVTEEYVCEACRHLVGRDDGFCWQCSEKLEPSALVEHYHRGERLTSEKFEEEQRHWGYPRPRDKGEQGESKGGAAPL